MYEHVFFCASYGQPYKKNKNNLSRHEGRTRGGEAKKKFLIVTVTDLKVILSIDVNPQTKIDRPFIHGVEVINIHYTRVKHFCSIMLLRKLELRIIEKKSFKNP